MWKMSRLTRVDVTGVFTFLAIWGVAVAYTRFHDGDWRFPLVSLGVFGVGLSLLSHLTTRGARVPAIPVARPAVETTALVGYLALYALGFLGWALGAVRQAVPEGRAQEVLILVLKLGVHVLLPALLLASLGARLAPLFGGGVTTRWFWTTLLVAGATILGLLCVVSPSLRNIAALNLSSGVIAIAAPVAFVWIALEAGLCEEFLYRAVIQTRLAALLGSEWAGIVVTSLLFGLAHAPGLYLRGGPGVDGWSSDPWQVVAFSISTLAPLSLFFGYTYSRTKSLLLVVMLHGCVDVLPFMSAFLRSWVL